MTLLNTETSVSIFVENFLAAILDIQNGCHQTAIFVHYSATKWDMMMNLVDIPKFWGQGKWCNPKHFWMMAIIKSKMAAIDRIP